ncbi:MAG TPA: FmdB family zinc ribbon protein [Pyrinomonadaceae bacterium]|jgi:putative FmdB family regulatory protein|nr:FmdB family zinc ribbon protein [Pyrinomonadaceae bacterium]
MPIYEYSCQKCGAHVEVMQKITDKPLKRCKSCGGKLEKEWSTTSFQLKGTGWYVTDYAAKKSGAGENESAPKSESASKTDGASETKAAPATETKAEPAASTNAAPAEETKRKKTSRPVATSNGSKSD